MQRINDKFFEIIDQHLSLVGKQVLEVGCGDGKRTVELAKRCASVIAIDPDATKLDEAKARQIPNATFQIGGGEDLPFNDDSFDAVFFTASFHHVPIDKMATALDEAVRVVRPLGHLAFLEPGEGGSFFKAEERFSIGDGAERPLITAAYTTLKSYHSIQILYDLDDETHFKFESVEDFTSEMKPKKNQSQIKDFLQQHDYLLRLNRRILIAQVAV